MQWLLNNLYVVVLAVGVIIYSIGFVVKRVTNGKHGNVLQNIASVIVELPNIINIAEKVGTNGEERKAYAMEQAELIAKSFGVSLTDAQKTTISGMIDKLVDLSKSINKTTKTSTIEPVKINGGTNVN